MKVFISYSRVDKDFVIQLAKTLRNSGIDLWLDLTDIPTGKRWDMEIEKALDNCTTFLLVISPDSVASQNVLDEVSFAIEEGKRIIPVLYRETRIPFRLRRFQYTDFTGDFNQSFASLMKYLHTDESAARPDFSSPAPSNEPEPITQTVESASAPVNTTTQLRLSNIEKAIRTMLTEGGSGNFAIFRIDDSKNYYLQASANKGDQDVYTEVVGNSVLESNNQLSSSQIDIILNAGWQEDQSMNFSQTFPLQSSEQFSLMLDAMAVVCSEVFGVQSEDEIEVDLNLE